MKVTSDSQEPQSELPLNIRLAVENPPGKPFHNTICQLTVLLSMKIRGEEGDEDLGWSSDLTKDGGRKSASFK